MNVSKKTITGALEELGVEFGISEADFDGKVKIEGKDPVVASKRIKQRAVRPNSIPRQGWRMIARVLPTTVP
jgi:hypothetical protein